MTDDINRESSDSIDENEISEQVTEIPETSTEVSEEPHNTSRNKTGSRRKGCNSVFFPILLIMAGFIFLFQNLNVIPGDPWDTLWNLWPLIFIAWGLDAVWRGEGLTGATFLLGIGSVFLLGNFGLLQQSPWQVLISIWPIIFVAIGLDILIGYRRTWWKDLVGMTLILVILFGLVGMSGLRFDRGQVALGEEIEYTLNGATQAIVEISPSVGVLRLDSQDNPDILLSGKITPDVVGQSSSSKYLLKNGTAYLVIRASGGNYLYISGDPNRTVWDLNLTTTAQVDLTTSIDVGEAELDLGEILLNDLDAKIGVGKLVIYLPDTGDYNAKITGAVGQIIVHVPDDIGIRIETSAAIVGKSIPNGFVLRDDDAYYSENYDNAGTRANISIDLAVGQLIIIRD